MNLNFKHNNLTMHNVGAGYAVDHGVGAEEK